MCIILMYICMQQAMVITLTLERKELNQSSLHFLYNVQMSCNQTGCPGITSEALVLTENETECGRWLATLEELQKATKQNAQHGVSYCESETPSLFVFVYIQCGYIYTSVCVYVHISVCIIICMYTCSLLVVKAGKHIEF